MSAGRETGRAAPAAPDPRPPVPWPWYASSPLLERLGYGLARVRAWARRATRAGLAARAGIWLAGLLLILATLPPSLWVSPVLPVAVVAALLPAAVPGGRSVGVIAVAAIGVIAVRAAVAGGIGTGSTGASAVELPVLLAVAGLLYVFHSAAALGAQLRTDAVIPTAVFARWAVRTGVVLAGGTAVALAVAVVAGLAPGWTGGVALLAGAVAGLGLIAALVWAVRLR